MGVPSTVTVLGNPEARGWGQGRACGSCLVTPPPLLNSLLTELPVGA